MKKKKSMKKGGGKQVDSTQNKFGGEGEDWGKLINNFKYLRKMKKIVV